METKFGFTKFTFSEFETWLNNLRVARTILYIQQHHTWVPSYIHFTGNNHFERQQAMERFHKESRGFTHIAQHFTTFPDGTIVSGRSMEINPAGISNFNNHAVCIEHLGDFDDGKDVMTDAQRELIINMTAVICKRYNIEPNTNNIVYHHWYDPGKSCCGTNFFGGNKRADAEAIFIPLVKAKVGGQISEDTSAVLKYAMVMADSLNIRKGAGTGYDKASDRSPATFGAVLRVYKEKDGWYKVSNSKQHWVSARYCMDVKRATVNANILNERSGPGTQYPKIGKYDKGTELFVQEQENGWSKVSFRPGWVKDDYLDF